MAKKPDSTRFPFAEHSVVLDEDDRTESAIPDAAMFQLDYVVQTLRAKGISAEAVIRQVLVNFAGTLDALHDVESRIGVQHSPVIPDAELDRFFADAALFYEAHVGQRISMADAKQWFAKRNHALSTKTCPLEFLLERCGMLVRPADLKWTSPMKQRPWIYDSVDDALRPAELPSPS